MLFDYILVLGKDRERERNCKLVDRSVFDQSPFLGFYREQMALNLKDLLQPNFVLFSL